MDAEAFAVEVRLWRDLVKELRERHEALLRIDPFENGVPVPERLAEYDRAKAAFEEASRRRDALRTALREKLRKSPG